MKNKGWHGEPQRHCLASRGIKTKMGRPTMLKSNGWWGTHPLMSDNGLDTVSLYLDSPNKSVFLKDLYGGAKRYVDGDTDRLASFDEYIAVVEHIYGTEYRLPGNIRYKSEIWKDKDDDDGRMPGVSKKLLSDAVRVLDKLEASDSHSEVLSVRSFSSFPF